MMTAFNFMSEGCDIEVNWKEYKKYRILQGIKSLIVINISTLRGHFDDNIAMLNGFRLLINGVALIRDDLEKWFLG